jgi:hypothetical protein
MGVSAAVGIGMLAGTVGTMAASGGFSSGSRVVPPVQPPPDTTSPIATAAAEEEAKKAAAKRRRSYANLGRSGTILTGPAGLDFNDIAENLYGGTSPGGKTLLGH